MAAHTFFFQKFRFSCLRIKLNSLMTAVKTGNVASSASHAGFFIELWKNLERTIQLVGANDTWQRFSHQILHPVDAVSFHIMGETADHIFHDTIAVLHNRCSTLYI